MKAVRSTVKQLVPYGLMCVWLRERYGIIEDLPLLAYPGFAKCLRRVVKFVLPYGLIHGYRRMTNSFPPPVRSACGFSGNRSIFHIDPAVANQDELNSRMAAEVTRRGISYAN